MLAASKSFRPSLSSSIAQARSVRRCVSTVVQDLRNPVAPVELRNGEVHIYWAFNEKIGDSCLERFQQCLTAEESASVNDAPDVRVKRQRLLARALTRTILPAYILEYCDAQNLEFLKSEHGKPFIAPRHFQGSAACDVDFNLTHTTSVVGCAVGRGVAVGLDVEEVGRRPRNVLRLAKRWFSPVECDLLAGVAGEEERARVFLQLWTLKEALVKARGTGISCPPGLRGFTLGLQQDLGLAERLVDGGQGAAFGAGGLRITLDPDKLPEGAAAFEFLLMQPSPDHVAALCVMRPPPGAPCAVGTACSPEEQHHALRGHHHLQHHRPAAQAATGSRRGGQVPGGPHGPVASQPPTCSGDGQQGRLLDWREAPGAAAGALQQGCCGGARQAGMARLRVRCWEVAGYGDVRPADGSCVVLGSSSAD